MSTRSADSVRPADPIARISHHGHTNRSFGVPRLVAAFRRHDSSHKAMSYERREKAEKELEKEVEALLQEAARVDAEEDGNMEG